MGETEDQKSQVTLMCPYNSADSPASEFHYNTLKGRNEEKGRLTGIYREPTTQKTNRCLPKLYLKVNSTGVQVGGPAESRRLWSDCSGCTTFISRLHLNYNPLLQNDLPEEAAHSTQLGGLALGTVKSTGSTIPPLKRDQLLAGGPECYPHC